jgi:alpha-glucosidase
MRKFLILLSAFLIFCQAAAQKPLKKIFSPDKKKCAEFFFQDSVLKFSLTDKTKDSLIISPSRLGVCIDTVFEAGTLSDTLLKTKRTKYSSVLRNDFGERRFQTDKYTALTLDFVNNEKRFSIETRLYNCAFAVRYVVRTKKNTLITVDKTEFNLSNFDLISYSEFRTEDGYRSSFTNLYNNLSPLLVFDKNKNFYATINEAANFSQAGKIRTGMQKGVYNFSQAFYHDTLTVTPWRYIVYGNTAVEMLENKYVIHSLNFPTDKDTNGYSWVKPGTVYRYAIQNYSFDKIKSSVDFCAENGIRYLLFDAGWYGDENDKNSTPLKPADGFFVKRAADYASEKNVGIILYVNQLAWRICVKEDIFDKFSEWGISGIKLGFMSSRSRYGLAEIYQIISEAAQRKMVVNVHDEMRQTGTEIIFKNFLTSEGLRGNEYTDNWAHHTMLLPFTRFMTGAGDYTICYPGYPENANGKVSKMQNTKCHQMALSVILFSPLQHIFWYGQPFLYTKKEEIEFFKDLPTVWDDFKIIDGEPGEHFTIARKSGKKWYLAAACFSARELKVNFDFLDPKKKYTAVFYEDDGKKGVKVTRGVSLTKDSEMSFTLKPSSGMTSVIEEVVSCKP